MRMLLLCNVGVIESQPGRAGVTVLIGRGEVGVGSAVYARTFQRIGIKRGPRAACSRARLKKLLAFVVAPHHVWRTGLFSFWNSLMAW